MLGRADGQAVLPAPPAPDAPAVPPAPDMPPAPDAPDAPPVCPPAPPFPCALPLPPHAAADSRPQTTIKRNRLVRLSMRRVYTPDRSAGRRGSFPPDAERDQKTGDRRQ